MKKETSEVQRYFAVKTASGFMLEAVYTTWKDAYNSTRRLSAVLGDTVVELVPPREGDK